MNSQPKESQIYSRKKSRIIIFFLFFVLLFGVFFLGLEKGREIEKNKSNQNVSFTESFITNRLSSDNTLDFSLFWKVWDLLKEKHIDRETFEANNLMYGAIKGMLQATKDPYTNFLTPQETKDFEEQLDGEFEGIGAEIGMKDNLLTIIAPLPDSPAEKAGLQTGDKIIQIDQKPANDLSVDEAVNLIKGERGTEVVLTIFREGEKETRDIAIVRDVIDTESVKLEFKKDNIVYIRISTFSKDTAKEFKSVTSEIIEKNPSGIVLDLRSNPGGLVDQCIEIASVLIEKGQPVVIEENNQGEKTKLKTIGGDRLSHVPIVVLINEGSASASEILAGALRDDRGVNIIGKKSFGKGTVQEYLHLPQETSTKITIAKWLTPNGEYIMEKGIEPNEEIDITREDILNDVDPQLDKALEVIQSEIKN